MSLVVTFGERTPILTPARSTPMTHLRSTVIVNSLKIVRDRGLDEEYWPRLQPETQETLRSTVALGWVPVKLAVEHYEVLNELIPDALDHWAIGKQAAERLQALYVRPSCRSCARAGPSPCRAPSAASGTPSTA